MKTKTPSSSQPKPLLITDYERNMLAKDVARKLKKDAAKRNLCFRIPSYAPMTFTDRAAFTRFCAANTEPKGHRNRPHQDCKGCTLRRALNNDPDLIPNNVIISSDSKPAPAQEQM